MAKHESLVPMINKVLADMRAEDTQRKVLVRKPRPRRLGYRASIAWLINNDDCDWADGDDDTPQSVTAAFVADCFGVDDEKVRKDLRRYLDVKGEGCG